MKKKNSSSHFRTRHRRRRWILILIVTLLAMILPTVLAFFDVFHIGGEATAEVFGVMVTAVGAIFVVFELQDNERVTCCDMMASMNFEFIENKRLMMLYQELEDCYRNPEKELVLVDDQDDSHIHTSDMMAYFTFYEVLYEYIKHGITDIQQMDDLFGDRFFKLIHNPYVQEHELYPVPSSYANIFELYGAWWEHRTVSDTDGSRLMAMKQNGIPEIYWKKKLYLQETAYMDIVPREITLYHKTSGARCFRLCRLFPKHMEKIQKLQDSVSSVLDVPGTFALSSEEEFLESILVDYCYGLFDGDRLVALALCVLNRNTPRNLGPLCPQGNCSEYITFDTIQVHSDYRGYGIQEFFLKEADYLARRVGARYIAATVAPHNAPSHRNFDAAGYKTLRTLEMKGGTYGNAKRDLVRKTIVESNG